MNNKNLIISDLGYTLGLTKYNRNHDAIITLLDRHHSQYSDIIKENCNLHFVEFFTDTENFKDPEAINRNQVEKVISVFKEIINNDKINNVLIHCFAGASRSTAFGISFECLQGNSPTDAFYKIKLMRGFDIVPNLLILRYADEILDLKNEKSLVNTIGPLKGQNDVSFVYEGW